MNNCLTFGQSFSRISQPDLLPPTPYNPTSRNTRCSSQTCHHEEYGQGVEEVEAKTQPKTTLMVREGHSKHTSVGSGRWTAGTGLKEQGVGDLTLVVANHLSRDNLSMVLGTKPKQNNTNMGTHKSGGGTGCVSGQIRAPKSPSARPGKQHRCSNVRIVLLADTRVVMGVALLTSDHEVVPRHRSSMRVIQGGHVGVHDRE